jgi:hypothetical protein
LLSCETLDAFACGSVRRPRLRRHQVPTLIGCRLLKIESRQPRAACFNFLPPGVCCVAASAAEKRDYEEPCGLRQQFYESFAASSLHTAPCSRTLRLPYCTALDAPAPTLPAWPAQHRFPASPRSHGSAKDRDSRHTALRAQAVFLSLQISGA